MTEAPTGPDGAAPDGAGTHAPDRPPGSTLDEHQRLAEQVAHMNRRLSEVAILLGRVEAAASAARGTPAWKRVTDGERRVQVALAVAVMIFLQVRIPARFSLVAWWVLPLIEVTLAVIVVVLDPGRISRTERHLRLLSLAFIAVASLANGWAAAYLVVGLVRGTEGRSAEGLLTVGGNIWLTNVIIFAIWYWELDRGGPAARAQALRTTPDFVFPQMTSPELAKPEWEPQFGDYLYLAFTDATAFSPTDVLPYSRWAKLAMGLQAGISIVVAALIIARAVNILQ
jgi:uncharacterized membrane protein